MILRIPSRRTVVVTVGLVVIAWASTVLIRRYSDPTREQTITARGLHHIIGEVAAQETAKQIGRTGQVVVVTLDPKPNPQGNPACELAGFLSATNQYGRLSVVAVVVVKPEETGTRFLELLKQYPDIEAIVSLAGAPALTAEQIRGLPREMPRVVVALGTTFRTQLKPLFREDIIQAAIIPRTGKPRPGPRPRTPREWYEYSFEVVTADTAAKLPE